MSVSAQNQTLFDFDSNSVKSSKPKLSDNLILDFATSAKTSIFRSGPSAPVKVLLEKQLLSVGSALNYGKGKYDFDTNAIKDVTGMCVGYDYTYLRVDVLGTSYNTLLSSYVVNTLPPQARAFVWCQMAECTAAKGVAFVAARTDKDNIKGTESEDGVITSIGTFQKGYSKSGVDSLKEEALNYFEYVVEIKGKSGFSLVACSHSPLAKKITDHQK